MRIVYINSPIYDYLTATLIEGLQELGHQVLCSEDSNYGTRTDERELVAAAETADLIIVGSNQGVRTQLLNGNRNPRKIYVDGADHPLISAPEEFNFELVFKRELLTTYRDAERLGILPLPFGGEQRYGRTAPESERSVKAAFLASLHTNPMRFGLHQRLVNLKDPSVLSGTTGERAYDPGKSKARPVETPKYRELLRQSRIGISAAGAGWDCARYWEILAAGAMLFTQALDIVIPNPFTDGVNCVTFSNFAEFEERLAHYMSRPELCLEIAARGQAHYLEHHTTRARAQYLLTECQRRMQQPAAGWSAAQPISVSALLTNQDASPESGEQATPDATPVHAAAARSEQKSPEAIATREEAPAALPKPNNDVAYYGHARPEVVQLVPLDARKVLDVGCGAGALGLAIKQRQRCHVTGIEYVPEVAERAATVLDEAIAGDAFVELDALPEAHFDAIVMADVLEHVDDTDRLLRLARERLAPAGRLVLSIPNVRHWSVVLPLLGGRWDYQDAGILDRTHLRFFTRHNMLEVLQRNGFEVENVQASMMPLDLPGGVFSQLIALGINPSDLLDDLQRYQYLLVCKHASALAA